MTPADREMDEFYRVMAPYYDHDHSNFLGGEDIALYLDLARALPGPVLEMGCGTGRVSLPLARAGIVIHGVDSSQSMLEQLRLSLAKEPREVQERLIWSQGDLRSLNLGRHFRLILAPGMVLHSFLERADQLAWLHCVRRHLAPDGELCFDTFQFDYQRLAAPSTEWAQDVDRLDTRTGRRVRRFVRCIHEPEFQRFRCEMRWVVDDPFGQNVIDETAGVMQRWFTRFELENLLELEGFRVIEWRSGLAKDPWARIVRAAPSKYNAGE